MTIEELKADELQRMAVLSFRKPVRQWPPKDAPVKGKRFKDYQQIGLRMLTLLEDWKKTPENSTATEKDFCRYFYVLTFAVKSVRNGSRQTPKYGWFRTYIINFQK